MSSTIYWRAEKRVTGYSTNGGAPTHSTEVVGHFIGSEKDVRAFVEECGHAASSLRLVPLRFRDVAAHDVQAIKDAKENCKAATEHAVQLQACGTTE